MEKGRKFLFVYCFWYFSLHCYDCSVHVPVLSEGFDMRESIEKYRTVQYNAIHSGIAKDIRKSFQIYARKDRKILYTMTLLTHTHSHARIHFNPFTDRYLYRILTCGLITGYINLSTRKACWALSNGVGNISYFLITKHSTFTDRVTSVVVIPLPQTNCT